MGEPVPHEFEPFLLNPVKAHPTLSFMREQACGLQNLEVPRCRLPSVLEYCRDITGRHRAPVKVNRQQHAPPGGMRQR
jgi:hypothetical protein